MTITSSTTTYSQTDSTHPYSKKGSQTQTSASELMAISQLQSIDTKVRAHESAHLSAGAGVVSGGASFSYTKGPDGKMYATAGEVPIDMSEGKTPEETVSKARQIAAAAMAPADPSPQDYRVAASAAVMEMRANMEVTQKMQNTVRGNAVYGESAQGIETAATTVPDNRPESAG